MKNEMGKLFIITGPSGVGKGTILAKFLKNNSNVKYSVSHTTRTPRFGEVEGVNYFFTTKEKFLIAVDNSEFLEYAKYGDNYYGTSKTAVEKSLLCGADVILEIEMQGAKQVIEKMPRAISVFIMPPSMDELEFRLRNRNTEDENSILKRLKIAHQEIEQSDIFKYKIENDTVENAVLKLQKIYDSEAK